jgi:WD40 repeat protein
VYHAKPDVKLIFSIPFNANYEKHLGPVVAIACSPFVKRLFLSASSDGTLRLYDILGHRPVAMFEPGYNEYLLDVQWSPFRPSVFATVSNIGTVYIYDLTLSKQSPEYVLKH